MEDFFNKLSDAYKSGQNPLAAFLSAGAPAAAPAPQTVRGWFEEWLYNQGIFETQAKQIMEYVIPKVDEQMQAQATEGSTGYKITWDRPSSEYPVAFYGVLIMTHKIKQHVFDWAEENMPLAWWKPMFDPNFKMPEQ